MPNNDDLPILQRRLENEKKKLSDKGIDIFDEVDDAGTITWVFDVMGALFQFPFPEDYPLSPPKITCFDSKRGTGFTKNRA